MLVWSINTPSVHADRSSGFSLAWIVLFPSSSCPQTRCFISTTFYNWQAWPGHSRRMMALQVPILYKAQYCARSTCSHTIDNNRHLCSPLLPIAQCLGFIYSPTWRPDSQPPLVPPHRLRCRNPGPGLRVSGPACSGRFGRVLFFCPIDTSVRSRSYKVRVPWSVALSSW